MLYAPLPHTIDVPEARSEALELIERAHGAERARKYEDAYDLHRKGANLLSQAIRSGKKKSVERRLDKLCLRASKERMKVLRNAAEGRGPPLVPPLPSAVTARLEMADLQPGKVMLSLVESRVWDSLMSSPTFQDLEFDDYRCPYLTPMLPKDAPEVVFHVYEEVMFRTKSSFYYLHVKDATKSQTLYSLYYLSPTRGRIKECTLSRATEYRNVCNRVYVGNVEDARVETIGKALTITTGVKTTRVDMPDRKKKWAPHRFTYGDRRFVWKGKLTEKEILYEVKSEFPMLRSKTGKVQDQTFQRPIAWIKYRCYSGSKFGIVGMAGGLDQVFQEFILASALSKRVVEKSQEG